MPWWTENKIRMVQNNLRETDAGAMDAARYAQRLEEMGANVAMIGCGGISALYPTALDFQRTSPYLKGDFVGDVIQACHDRDIRVIIRFDFCKADAGLIDKHPDWFIRNDDGECMVYSGTGAVCINGGYYQERIFDILGEALHKYPADGIFFNALMFGSFDYDGNRCNICRCENCQALFREYAGHALPPAVDPADPVYQQYLTFQADCVSKLLDRIRNFTRDINPEIAVSTYNNNVDIIRNESNTAVDRPLPFWIYASTDNAGTVMETFEGEDKISCNVVINSVDFFSRFAGVSPELTKIRLLGNMACGGGLDWCIIGDFEDYPDREAFPVVKEVFAYHKRYEDIFSVLRPDARIMLVRNRLNNVSDHDMEYRGIFKMLKEAHLNFRIVDQQEVDRFAGKLDEYDVVLLPNVLLDGSSAFAAALETTTARVIATGLTMQNDPALLKQLFGIVLGPKLEKPRGHYLLTSPKEVFRSLPDTDWVYLDMDYRPMELDPGVEGWLPLVLPAPFGPPEFCYGHRVSEQSSVSVKNGRMVYFPFMLGDLYYRHGFAQFKRLLLDVLDAVGGVENPFATNAPDCVEMFWHRCGQGKMLVQLLNLSGCNGITTGKPLPIHNIELAFHKAQPKRVVELAPGGENPVALSGGKLAVPVLDEYKAYLLEV